MASTFPDGPLFLLYVRILCHLGNLDVRGNSNFRITLVVWEDVWLSGNLTGGPWAAQGFWPFSWEAAYAYPGDLSASDEGLKTQSHTFPPVIELNVGGKHYTTSHLTLVKCKDTMLSAMFSGDYSVKKDQNGRYFIDADGDNFQYILNYLRYGELPPQDVANQVYREATYFGLHGLTEALEKSPSFLARIHRDSYRTQFPGYQRLINSIIDKMAKDSTTNCSTTSHIAVVLFAKNKQPKLSTFDKNHWCIYKAQNKRKERADLILGPWSNKTTEKEVMNCIDFDLKEKGFNITHEVLGQCNYRCDSPPDYPGQPTVENCTKTFFRITFHWWKM
ncbi:hypothetical protein FSP39_006289 [Pinctada imbricata]|uniref:BTB domain-containing protein n=1 Tax=Pinctada imbricata TaxID=66713 RepID=A0AA89BV13_PINIB|nr:hypothetical protein FSP39_006289 [Pinctada imbricata]